MYQLGSFGRTLTLHDEEKDSAVVGLKALGDRKPTRFASFRNAAIRLGRGLDCHIRVSDRHVSELQCFFFRKGDAWLLTPHREAKNPTFVDTVEERTGAQSRSSTP
jgi:pSer/pThr/pTyr-binding forkhead associated (FHA) protein